MEFLNMVDKRVGDRVRSRRVALGMSQEELADTLRTAVPQLQEWEAGTTRFGAERLLELTRILHVRPAFFFSAEHEDPMPGEAGPEEVLSAQPVGAPPPAEVSRLIRAFTGIGNPEFREIVIKLVETVAGSEVGWA